MANKNLDKSKEITDITFDHENAHLAYTHLALQGGASNHWNEALILKSLGKEVSTELLKSLQQVSVTLSMEEFLKKFFYMYSTDAEILTKLLGFETEYEAWLSDNQDDSESNDDWYQNYLEGQIEGFEILKSAYESEEVKNSDDLISILKSQIKFEDGVKEMGLDLNDVGNKTPVTKAVKNKTTKQEEVNVSKSANTTDDNGQDFEELLKAAVTVELDKANEKATVELEKANKAKEKLAEELEIFKSKEKEIQKASMNTFVEGLEFIEKDKSEEISESLFKSAANDEAFEVVYDLLKAAQSHIDALKVEFTKSDDTGVETKQETIEKSSIELQNDRLLDRIRKENQK